MTETSESATKSRLAVETPHARPLAEVVDQLNADLARGLAADEARQRLELTGPNRIAEDTGPGRLELLARQFKDLLVLILLAAAAISGLVLGDWLEAGVIAAIVLVNAAIGYAQESKAADAAAGLRRLTAPSAKVIRDGLEQQIPTEAIVPGDLVVLEAGDRVFADIRLAETARLQTDESELTGESTPVFKVGQPVDREASLGDRKSMAFSGTVVVSGRGIGVVTATGQTTEIGKIADMLEEEEPPTPLETELQHVSRRLALLAGLVAVAVVGVGLAGGRSFESVFLLAVALAVAAIPEGLPAVVGVTLGRGVQQMARRNAIVRRMPAVEALGSVTVICTDKTGTLTRNEIGVQEIVFDGDHVARSEASDHSQMTLLAELSILCNDARRSEGGWQGDPTEIALLDMANEVIDVSKVRLSKPRVDELPFESERKRMTTAHRSEDGILVATKGAPETVIPLCHAVETVSGQRSLTEESRSYLLDSASGMAGRGLRTLAIAYRMVPHLPAKLEDVEAQMVLVGVVGMRDDLRPEARQSVEEAKAAGIEVVMITGDHEITAASIADDLNLLEGKEVMGGRTLRAIDAGDLAEQIEGLGAFARVDPADKVQIVQAWQQKGHRVAMTGDGVNDAPALRIAEIGVAMGSGTDVARDASDIVLADDNFSTIVAAVRAGRAIFANLRKVIAFLLAANVSEVVVVFAAFLLFSGFGDPLLATQILWVNLITDGLPAVAIGFDPPDGDVMRRPPSRRASLLDPGSQWSILIRGVLLALVVLASYVLGVATDLEWEVTRTLGFTVLVFVQLSYLYGLRVAESGWRDGLTKNPLLHLSVVGSVVLQVLVVTTSVGNRLFETVPLTAELWAFALASALGAGLLTVMTAPLLPSRRDR